MEPDPPMFPTRDRNPVSPRLGRAWLCCWLVAASACADGSGGGPDAAPTSDGGGCTPGCADNAVRTCVPVETSTPCPLGCDDGAPACRELVPSNGADRAQLTGVTADLRIPSGGTYLLDTDSGQIIDLDSDTDVREGGEGVVGGIGFYALDNEISVLAVQSLTLEADAFLLANGFNALVVLSAGDVVIQGEISVSAVNLNRDGKQATQISGPGGGNGASPGVAAAEGCAPGADGKGVDGVGDETGGGGGGLGSSGAPGGVGADGTQAGAGGEASSSECPGSDLVPLRGGSGGGAGGIDTGAGGAGGGGGGAIQISSFTRIQVVGSPGQFVDGILANGGGGGAGDTTVGGGGGGSGGAILLEAPEMEVKFVILAANGGGGGGSDDGTGAEAGEDGRFDMTQAQGGGGQRPGGRGAALNGGATIGSSGADGTGGGGGGVGIIRFNVPMDFLEVEAATISPMYTRDEPQSR
jgi:hypothetical protein